MKFELGSAFDSRSRKPIHGECAVAPRSQRPMGAGETLMAANWAGREPESCRVLAQSQDSRIDRNCLFRISWMWVLLLSVCVGAIPLRAEAGQQQLTPLKVVGVITEVQPSSLRIRAADGNKVTLYTRENFTGKVGVGSIVQAWYYVYDTGNALGRLEYPPPMEITGIATAVDPTTVTVRGRTGQEVRIQTEENLTAKLTPGSTVTASYYPLTAGNFLYQLKQSPGHSPPQAARVDAGTHPSGQPGESAVADLRQQQESSSPPPTAADDYLIGSEDVLNINVWGEPQLSGVVTVRPDGKISTPLAGEIEASGRTPRQLQAGITERLQGFVSNPVVTVIVQEVRSRKINVVGQVQRPGTYPLTGSMRVLDAIALAGGFREFAKVKNVYVLRTDPGGTQQLLPFNYKQVVRGRNPEQNIELENGDTVVVP